MPVKTSPFTRITTGNRWVVSLPRSCRVNFLGCTFVKGHPVSSRV